MGKPNPLAFSAAIASCAPSKSSSGSPSPFVKMLRLKGNYVRLATYFHSQILVRVFPFASTSYSKTPGVAFSRASFCDVV